jgi:MFS family permease
MISDLEQESLEAGIQPPDEDAPAKRVTFVDVLRNANFRNLWLGQIVSQIGDYFAFLALTVVVSGFSNTTEGTVLAVSGLLISFSLPRLLFGLLAGVFVDRWDRRRTMLVSDLVRVVLALFMIPAFLAASLPAIFALAFLMSTVGTLFGPAKTALIPRLVSKEQLLSANALSQTSQMLATMIGPALAGFTLATAGEGNEWVALVVDSATFLVSAFTIWLIRMPGTAKAPDAKLDVQVSEGGAYAAEQLDSSSSAISKVWQELKVGLKALVFNGVIGMVAIVMSITMLGVGAINVLWVVFLKTEFGYEGPELAWRLSLLDIVFSVGMVAASVVVGNLLSGLAPKWLIVVSLVGAGAPIAVFGFLPDYWWLLGASTVMGIFVAPINTGVSTLIQIVTPNRMLGRVGGGIGTVSETSSILSMSLAGVVGATIGIPLVFAIAGGLCITGGLASLVLPALTLKDMVPDEPTTV